MRSQHDGMSLWYGTPDAPAPEGDVQIDTDLAMTIGVQPVDASNRVELLYHMNHGPLQTIEVRWLRNDLSQNVQYFRTRFPVFRIGDTVEYTVVCRCAGRQVPPTGEAEPFPSSFHVIAAESHASTTAPVEHEAYVLQTEETHGTVPKEPIPVVSTPSYTIAVGEPVHQPQPAMLSPEASYVATTTITDPVVEPHPKSDLSEYEHLLAEITPLLEGVPLADLTDDNLSFLAAKAGVERNRLKYHRQAAQLSRQTDLPSEVFYAFAREDLPLDLKSLLSSDPDTLRGMLETAIKRGIIPVGLLNSLPEITARLAKMKSDTTPVSELAAVSGVELPSALRSFLDERGIHTLADIRAGGGIAHIEGLPVSQDDTAVETLEAHACLSVLPGTPSMNARLVNAGYKSLGEIAGTSRETFIDVFKDQLRPDVASIIHAAATMQTGSLNNLLTELHVSRLNGSLEEETVALLEDVCPQVCGCQDCENATSPLAYLADLLDYTVHHLKQHGNAVTLTSLEKGFHQPFRDLPATCELMDQQVRRVRICIEVLRQYLPAQYGKSTSQWYLETAYRLLLERHGTSFDEIRRARNLKPEARIKLAERLGFALNPFRSLPTNPDELDFLLLDIDPNAPARQPWPVKLSEESLELFFGLRDTNRPPLVDPVNVPLLLQWRIHYLRDKWFREDWVDTPSSFAAPFIDPDIVGTDDIKDTPTAMEASNLRDDRKRLLELTEAEMKQFIKQSGFDLLLQDRDTTGYPLGGFGLGQSIVDLVALRDKRDKNKHDITGDLQNLQISEEAFDYLVFVAELYKQPSPILLDEWDTVTTILLQRWKQNNKYPAWRKEEQTAQITLNPDYFRLRSGTPFGRNSQWQPKPWRSVPEVRQKWEDILRTRIEQEQALKDHIEAATNAVEEALLVELRDELLPIAFLPGLPTPEKLRELTQHLQIDLQADICQMTTRVAQAIETIQGLLFGTRNGLLDTEGFILDAPIFDEEWKWLGSYATWRAAMQVFLYPENALRPTLRQSKSPAFASLVERLRSLASVTPEDVQREISAYEVYFKDICSLSFAALGHTAGPFPSDDSATDSAAVSIPYFSIMVRAGASGKFYTCADDRKPEWWLNSHPNRTFWREIPGLEKATNIVGVLPYQPTPGLAQIGLYASIQLEGPTVYLFTSYDGAQWRSKPDPFNTLPWLVCTAKSATGNIPIDASRSTAGFADWYLRGDDQIVALDVDGDGRKEIVLLARDGSQRIALLRERSGGLLSSWTGRLQEGWRLPEGPPVVLRTKLVRSPSQRIEKLLLVNSQGSQPQLGLLEWQSNESLALTWSTSDGFVHDANGQGGWQVNLRPEIQDVVMTAFVGFTAADIDGDGRSELLTVEHETRSLTSPPHKATKTSIYIFTVLDNTIVFNSSHEVFAPSQSPINLNYTDRQWDRFIPIEEEGTSAFIVAATRVQYVTGTDNEFDQNRWVGILRWDLSTNNGFAPIEMYAEYMPGYPAEPVWVWRPDDELLPVDLDKNAPGQEILLTNNALPNTAVLRHQKSGPLGTIWQYTNIWHHETQIDPVSGSSAQPWKRQAGDRLVAADLNGDGIREIVVFAAASGQVGVLEWSSAESLQVRWSTDGWLNQPDGRAEAGWQLSLVSECVVADINGDDREELIVLSRDDPLNGRIGVLSGIPAQQSAFSLGLKDRYGPSGVRALTIVEKRSEQQIATRQEQIKTAYNNNDAPDDPDVVYIDEAYYFIPMEVALRLRESGNYTEALDWLRSLYDYERPIPDRKIAYKLVLDEQSATSFVRYANWLRDPLNPHAIAETRKNSYTRFTILAIVRCLLDFADSEFTRATSESVARARALYEEALELLDLPEIKQQLNTCADKIAEITFQVGEEELPGALNKIKQHLFQIRNYKQLTSAVNRVKAALGSEGTMADRLAAAQKFALEVQPDSSPTLTYGMILEQNAATRKRAEVVMLAEPKTERCLLELGKAAAGPYRPEAYSSAFSITGTSNGREMIFTPNPPVLLWDRYIPAPILCFCVPPNKVIQAARFYAEMNLHKIQTCRNIAGMQMRLDPYALPTLAEASLQNLGSGDSLPALQKPTLLPLPYRYVTLIERAKQLVQLAQQVEASMLASLQSKDHEEYELLKARQDLEFAQAGQRLKELQVVEATDGIRLAQLQRERAQIQRDEYSKLLRQPISALEYASLGLLGSVVLLRGVIATMYFAAGMQKDYSVSSFLDLWAKGTENFAAGLSSAAEALGTAASITSALASYERRAEEWRFDEQLATQDVHIGEQQILQAQDHVQVANQDRAIAAMQVEHAGAMVDFLANKFTNPDLFDWMSNVLEQVYRFFLNEATSIAKLAETQLSFERQEIPPAYIQANYWEPPSTNPPPVSIQSDAAGQTINIRGLTGAERLLQDIYQLDQYAFKRNQRKLQLSKTISLAQRDPFAFQRFRETGVLNFATPMDLFDRDFPGHYVRLIKRVRMSVIALIPPTLGIRATLSTTGTSRVIIGSAPFQRVVVQRGPESVALTSAINATGVFELDPQADLLVPFEGIGVDTTWELRMPRPANPFDYTTIADVLITIEYTALHSYDYQHQVLEGLRQDQRMSADRAFSFRTEFADAWYDLHNPELVEDEQKQMVVTFKTERADFPPNLEENSITVKQIVLYFAHAPGKTFKQIQIAHLRFQQDGNTDSVETDAEAEGVISTRTTAFPQSWEKAILRQKPFGEWELSLKSDEPDKDKEIRDRFKNEEIEDILFVITYSGDTPEWPT